jgi:hypothetical protein
MDFRRYFRFKKERCIFADTAADIIDHPMSSDIRPDGNTNNDILSGSNQKSSKMPYWKKFNRFPFHDWTDSKY